MGGVRVAMRDSGLPNNPYFLLGDHLGSTAITANNSGAMYTELRYKAWGESRYTNGTTLTTYHFTGQREVSYVARSLFTGSVSAQYRSLQAMWAPCLCSLHRARQVKRT